MSVANSGSSSGKDICSTTLSIPNSTSPINASIADSIGSIDISVANFGTLN